MGTQTHWDLRIGNVPVCTRLGQGKSTKPLFSFLSFFSCNPGRLNIDLFCSCQGTAWTSFSNDTVTRFKSHKGMACFLSPLLSSRLVLCQGLLHMGGSLLISPPDSSIWPQLWSISFMQGTSTFMSFL